MESFLCSTLFQDKYHLFTWTDERIVEEVEDMKVLVSDLEEKVSDMRSEMVGLAKQLEYSQHMLEMPPNGSSTG